MASAGERSCMVYIVAADIKPRAYDKTRIGLYRGNYKQLLKSSELISTRFTPRSLPHMHAVGLAQLVPGILSDGVRTVWSPQEQLWWACLRFADDVLSYEVVNVSKAITPAPITSHY